MIYINEWLPNPVGNDAAGEFVELYNSSGVAVGLDGYAISAGKKATSLSGYSIAGHGYLVLNKKQSKLSLKNSDGGLWLYGPSGQPIDYGAFTGAAPEGKSFSRINYSAANIQHFAFVYPTPGVVNKTIDTTVSMIHYPIGVSLSPQLTPISFMGITLGTAFTLAILFIYVIKKDYELQKLFFGRDEAVRP
jgi:Lamin Tail Domain